MTTHVGERDELERRLVQALEHAPQVAIPEGFAARVAGNVTASVLPVRGAMPAAGSVGNRVAWATAAVLLAAMFALAPGAGVGARHWLEFGVTIEFATLTAWLALRPLLPD